MNARQFISKVPVPICGLALALASLDIFLSQRYDLYSYSILAALSAIIMALFTIRIVVDWRGIIKDIENPAAFAVLPTYTMTLMLLSTYIKNFAFDVALAVWLGAIIMSFVFMFFFVKKFMLKFNMMTVFPSWVIVFVGYVVASVTSPTFGMQDLGKILFWCGLIGYLIILPLAAYRTLKVRKIPEPLTPQIAIFAAPANLCIVGGLSAFGGSPPEFVLILLIILSVVSYIAVMAYMPKMLNSKFYPSYAALTFPLVISAVSFYRFGEYYGLSSVEIFVILREITVAAAILMVVYVFIRYVIYLYRTAKGPGTTA
ncbi:potassium-tellurite ethidium and proflavin transporter [Candidatus Methanoplasma termitum]|uniref:Potassium-tellurite ethidium and proflavin transporter n=1 Tax=Candidatus Methanoplasma termitum TaxID=1577791 RepID=A0A0A7LFX9_9ARCH|nr:TDT family transporter [Candidatus Methanoplasma termitum]AIZ56411.1 potassium-tellurite ethidium and proflavin transporter [Candidatus Methanoplasma termitum]